MKYDDFVFISKGEWFDEGTEVKVDILYRTYGDSDSKISYSEMIEHKNDINGVFVGLRHGKHDSELCILDEFIIKQC